MHAKSNAASTMHWLIHLIYPVKTFGRSFPLSRSREYTDLASLGSLPKYTCGQLYYYPSFAREKDGVKLTHEVVHNLTRTTGELLQHLHDNPL